jgi:hypothetical protein
MRKARTRDGSAALSRISAMELAKDPLGRMVRLTEERWSHIVDGHPYMTPFRADVMRPSQWLKVVGSL